MKRLAAFLSVMSIPLCAVLLCSNDRVRLSHSKTLNEESAIQRIAKDIFDHYEILKDRPRL